MQPLLNSILEYKILACTALQCFTNVLSCLVENPTITVNEYSVYSMIQERQGDMALDLVHANVDLLKRIRKVASREDQNVLLLSKLHKEISSMYIHKNKH
jgi:hypothetical protein